MSPDPDPDAWLDAFDPAELDHPDLDEVDASVDRVLRRLGRHPSEPAVAPVVRSRAPYVAVVVALAAGALLGAWWTGSSPTVAPIAAPRAPIESVATIPSPSSEAAPEAAAELPEAPAPSPGPMRPPEPGPRVAPPVPPIVAPEAPPALLEAPAVVAAKLPGLAPHSGAKVSVEGDAAVLVSGLLTWTHDERHDPGVSYVVWRDLPLVVRPVGTEFTVASAHPLASVSVREGHVRVEHTDGSLLAALGPGQELTVVADPRSPLGLRLLETDDLPLDEVAALASRRLCSPEELVALVASLRLSTFESPVPMGLPIELPEEP